MLQSLMISWQEGVPIKNTYFPSETKEYGKQKPEPEPRLEAEGLILTNNGSMNLCVSEIHRRVKCLNEVMH